MEKFWFVIEVILLVLIVVTALLVWFVFYVPEGIFLITGYNDKDENGNPHYTIEGFNYGKERREIYTVNEEAYNTMLTSKRNFYKIYRRGTFGKKMFMVEINDDEALCD